MSHCWSKAAPPGTPSGSCYRSAQIAWPKKIKDLYRNHIRVPLHLRGMQIGRSAMRPRRVRVPADQSKMTNAGPREHLGAAAFQDSSKFARGAWARTLEAAFRRRRLVPALM